MKSHLLSYLTIVSVLLAPIGVVRAQDFPFGDLTESDALTTPSGTGYAQDSSDHTRPTFFGDDGAECCCELPRIEATASLLYLRPGSGSLEYGTLVSPFPAASPHWENQAIRPDLSPAFNFGLRYRVSETGNDIRTSWTHLDSTDSASFAGNPVTNFAGPSYLIGPGATNYNLGSGSVNFRYDAVNLEVGHLWGASRPFQLRGFGGMQYGSIHQTLSSLFEDSQSSDAHSNTMNSRFAGVGPRFGVNAQLNRRNFQLIGDMAAVALIGTGRSEMDFNTISALLPGGNPQSFTSPDETQIVPGLDSRLGGARSFKLGRGICKIEAGYQGVVYLDAVNSYTLTQVATPPVIGGIGVFFATAEHLQNNFTAHGPYLSTSWAF